METEIRRSAEHDESGGDTGIIRCSLYVAGRSSVSIQAMDNLARLQAGLDLPLDVRVIDIRQQPDAAIRDRILCAPTLIVHRRGSSHRLIGNLSDTHAVLQALGSETTGGGTDRLGECSLPIDVDLQSEPRDGIEGFLRRRVAELERTLVNIRRSQLLALWSDDSSVGHAAHGPESDRVYRDIVESLPAGLLLLNAEEIVLYANQAGANLFDRSRDGIVGLHLADLVSTETIAALARIPKGESASVELTDTGSLPWHRDVVASVFPIDAPPFSIRCLMFVDRSEREG